MTGEGEIRKYFVFFCLMISVFDDDRILRPTLKCDSHCFSDFDKSNFIGWGSLKRFCTIFCDNGCNIVTERQGSDEISNNKVFFTSNVFYLPFFRRVYRRLLLCWWLCFNWHVFLSNCFNVWHGSNAGYNKNTFLSFEKYILFCTRDCIVVLEFFLIKQFLRMWRCLIRERVF